MNNNYKIETKILDMCESQLKKLEKLNVKIEKLKPDFDNEACLLYTSPSPRDS